MARRNKWHAGGNSSSSAARRVYTIHYNSLGVHRRSLAHAGRSVRKEEKKRGEGGGGGVMKKKEEEEADSAA